MEDIGAEFVISGEVVGQRPMSQHRPALRTIEKESELEDKREQRRQCISSIHGCDGKGLLHSAFHVSGQQSDLLKLSYTSVKDGALMYIFTDK